MNVDSVLSLQQCIIPMQTKLADDADAGLIKLRTKRSNVRGDFDETTIDDVDL